MDTYDKNDMYSIEEYAQGMVGRTFADICAEGLIVENIRNKGRLGIFIEKYFFHYEPNSNPGSDFEEAGVELKTTGYIVNRHNQYKCQDTMLFGAYYTISILVIKSFIREFLRQEFRFCLPLS